MAYIRLSVPVPKAQVQSALPDYISFYVDTRFNSMERARINVIIGATLAQWERHYAQRATSGRSVFQTCANSYATQNLKPFWLSSQPANGAAAGVMMDGLTRQIIANGFNRSGNAYIYYEVPTNTNVYFTIKAEDGRNPDTYPLSVTMNPEVLDRRDLSTLTMTGSLLHAWMHRQGFRHQRNIYTSTFAGEAAMCIMVNNTGKVPGQSDTVYTRYLD